MRRISLLYRTAGADAFFGANGVLRNLLTGILVALRPTIVASVAPALAARLQRAVVPDTSLRIGGLSFAELQVSPPSQAGGPALLTATSATVPSDAVIVGATVATLGTG